MLVKVRPPTTNNNVSNSNVGNSADLGGKPRPGTGQKQPEKQEGARPEDLAPEPELPERIGYVDPIRGSGITH
jgi:hypothetical protein